MFKNPILRNKILFREFIIRNSSSRVHHNGARSSPIDKSKRQNLPIRPTTQTTKLFNHISNYIPSPKLRKETPCVNTAWCIGWLATTQPKTPSSAQQPKPGTFSSVVIGTTHTGNASQSLATARSSHPHYLDGVKIV